MPEITGLHRKGSTYYLRLRVPKDLLDVYFDLNLWGIS